MTTKINSTVLTENQFISIMQEIGRDNHTNKFKDFESIKTQQFCTFKEIPSLLSNQIDFFKGLVLCERDFRWVGGSAASNIKIFRKIKNHPFMMRHQDKMDELINWALQNRGINAYTPFGTWRYAGCRSINQMRDWERLREAQHRRQLAEESVISKEKAKRNSIRSKLNKLRPLRRYVQAQTYDLNIELFMLEDYENRFNLLLKGKLNFPVNLVPESFWEEIIKHELSAYEIKALLQLLPRKTSTYIKETLKPELRRKKRLAMVSPVS